LSGRCQSTLSLNTSFGVVYSENPAENHPKLNRAAGQGVTADPCGKNVSRETISSIPQMVLKVPIKRPLPYLHVSRETSPTQISNATGTVCASDWLTETIWRRLWPRND